MMTHTLLTILLDSDWRCAYAEPDSDAREATVEAADVPSLSGWHRSEPRAVDATMWLQRAFSLMPQDVCVRYWLVIESAPSGTQVRLNRTELGETGGHFRADVTDAVWLEDNILTLRVPSGAQGAFGGIHLQAVPCE